MSEQEDGVSFVDGEAHQGSWGKKDEISFRKIVMEHLQRIARNANCEFRGGYWEERPTGMTTVKVYIPDTRETYCNSIDVLADLLLPHFDAEMTKAEELVDQDLERAREEFHKKWDGTQRTDVKMQSKQDFRTEKVAFKRRLLRHLSQFLKRKGYFDAEMADE